MEDWITVRQAATMLEISVSRVYVLIANGTLSSKKLGSVRLVSRRSVALYKESPNRNKFAGGHLKQVGEGQQPGLFDPPQEKLQVEPEEWSGLSAPTLSVESRRLYDASPEGLRAARLAASSGAGGG